MSYYRKTYDTPIGRYVEEYHTGRASPKGEKRAGKKNHTPEEIEKNNQRIKEKNIQLLLMNNFVEHDYFATLTYRKEMRPRDMKAAKADMAKALKTMRREYQKRGEELKWIYNIEKGSRGGWHVHLVLNRIRDTDLILKKAWGPGGVHTTLLYEEGGYRELAGYLSKTVTGEEEEGKKETGYSRSRNLVMPQPQKKQIKRWDTWKDDIRIPPGYALDKESVQEGYNKAGYPYRRYVLLATEERRKKNAGSPSVHRGRHGGTSKKKKKGDVRPGAAKGRRRTGDQKGDSAS